jgi:hypothetical protein
MSVLMAAGVSRWKSVFILAKALSTQSCIDVYITVGTGFTSKQDFAIFAPWRDRLQKH